MSVVTNDMLFIEVATGHYPMTLPAIRDQLKTTVSLSPSVPLEDLINLGFSPVADTPIPAGDVVTEGVPALVDGVWTRVWNARSFTEEELNGTLSSRKADLLAQADTLQSTAFAVGFPYTFKEGVYHVQVRGQDRANLTSLRIIAKEVVVENGTQGFAFRVYENVSIPLTAQEMVELADMAFLATNIAYQKLWAFKDGVTAATTVADLPTLPTDLFS